MENSGSHSTDSNFHVHLYPPLHCHLTLHSLIYEMKLNLLNAWHGADIAL